MISCYRSVVRHPFLIGMIIVLISMYRSFPSLFSLLASASPVIVSTAVLLGTLLSFGQPNIPEIEKESESDGDEIRKLESKVASSHTKTVERDAGFASEEINGTRIEVGDKSFVEKVTVNDDNCCVEIDRPANLVDECKKLQFGEEHIVEKLKNEMDEENVVFRSHYSPIHLSEDHHIVLESHDKLWEGSADPLNSDPGLLMKRVEGGDSEDDEGSDSVDSGSDLAESSSPDASMADIIPMLDELHPLLADEPEICQPAHMLRDGTNTALEHLLEASDSSSSESNDDGSVENHEDLDVGVIEDKESKHTDKEDEIRSAIRWTEDDQNNLMNLGTSELERNQHLENLIARRAHRSSATDDASEHLLEASNSSGSESNDDNGVENHEDLDVGVIEDEESKHTDKEDEVRLSAITWTEDDQKNLMDLGTSELERNRHLENLIARRAHMSRATNGASEHLLEASNSCSSSNESDDGGVESHDDLDVGVDEYKESKHADREDEIRSAIRWTEDDQKNLMNLGTSELERNRHLENLIARRAHMSCATNDASEHLLEASNSSSSESNDDGGVENHEDLNVGVIEDKEPKNTDTEDEARSAITWTEDDQKNLMNLGKSDLERNRHLENLIARRAHMSRATHTASEHLLEASNSSGSESSDDRVVENHEDLDVVVDEDKDKESKHTDKEDEIRSVITWTEDDQKNLMDLGTSELERNRRLENLIARRRARKSMRMQTERNLIGLDTADLPWNLPPISTARNNPFDYDANDSIPGSAPSVLSQRRNPFDLPYDSNEEKPDLVGDTFQQEFAAFQPKEPYFRRHESFNVGPSSFGALRRERQETKLRPYFVPEQVTSDGSFSSFQRQLSGLSDSKLSSVPDTDSVSSDDLENKDHIKDDQFLETKVVSEQDHENTSEIRDHPELVSESGHPMDESEHVSDQISHGRPYFVPEQVASDGTSFPSFQRQLSEVSESKGSSLPDTESVSSDDIENTVHIEKDISQGTELIHVEEHEHASGMKERPKLVSQREHAVETREHVSQGSESSEDDGNVESIQGQKRAEQLDEAQTSPATVINQQEVALDSSTTENATSSMELMSDAVHLKLGDLELHSNASSLSSSYEASDQIYNEKEGHKVPTSVSETAYCVVDHGNSVERSGIDISSLLVEENHLVEPRYDSSPRAVTRNPSSSSISNDLQAYISRSSQLLATSEKPDSLPDREFQGASDVLTSNTDHNLHESELNLESLASEDHLHTDDLVGDTFQQEFAALSLRLNNKRVEQIAHDFQTQETEYVSDLHSDIDGIKEIDESLLVELDAVGDDLGSTSNETKAETRALEHDLGSNLNEMKQDSHTLDHDLETNHSVDEDLISKDLQPDLSEMKQELHVLESVDESTSNEMMQDSHTE